MNHERSKKNLYQASAYSMITMGPCISAWRLVLLNQTASIIGRLWRKQGLSRAIARNPVHNHSNLLVFKVPVPVQYCFKFQPYTVSPSMRKQLDPRIPILINNNVQKNHRSFIVLVGDKGRDQASFLLKILSYWLTVILDCESSLPVISSTSICPPFSSMVLQKGAGLY